MRLFLLLFGVTFTGAMNLCAGETSHFDVYSKRIANSIDSQKKSFMFAKVRLIDFTVPHTGIDASGVRLAGELSQALEKQLPPGRIIPRVNLREFLAPHGISTLDLRSVSLAYGVADRLGANEIPYGEMSPASRDLVLKLRLLGLSDTKEVARWDLTLPNDEDLEPLLGKTLDRADGGPISLALRCGADDFPAVSKALFQAGGTVPKAFYMPNPPCSEEARKNKLSGQTVYDVYWDMEGYPYLVVPRRPLKPEFDGIAVETIRKWQAHPATMDGKPVPVCTPVKVTWRMY